MITDLVKKMYAHHSVLPVNVCTTCGDEDDPESARNWPRDDDGDRKCWGCHELAKAIEGAS